MRAMPGLPFTGMWAVSLIHSHPEMGQNLHRSLRGMTEDARQSRIRAVDMLPCADHVKRLCAYAHSAVMLQHILTCRYCSRVVVSSGLRSSSL